MFNGEFQLFELVFIENTMLKSFLRKIFEHCTFYPKRHVLDSRTRLQNELEIKLFDIPIGHLI